METFHKEYRGNVVVISVNLVSATLNDTNEFKDFMDELILLTECDVVVDLANCEHLDSTFIGALVINYKKLKEKNRNMVLVEPNDQTKVFLTMNSLSKIFPLYPNVEVAVEDLLNRNMLEKHLTNQKHNLVFPGSNEEINETSDPEKVIENDSDVKAAAENFDELNQDALVEQEINQRLEGEKLETAALVELDDYEEEKSDLNEMSVEDSQNDLVQCISSQEETDGPDIEKDETDKFIPEERSGELVEEQNSVERDYREGTLSWDFGC